MKKKIFSIFFVLVLVCSFSLVTAVPVAAVEPVYEPTINWWQSSNPDSGVAEFSTAQFHSADYSAHLVAKIAYSAEGDYHEAYVANPTGVVTLDDLEDVSFWYYCPSGDNAVAPLIDVWLDLDDSYSRGFSPGGDEEWLLGMLEDVTTFDAWVPVTSDNITWVRAMGGEVYGVGAAGLTAAKAETDDLVAFSTLGASPVLAVGVETGGPGTYISSRSYDMDFYIDDLAINGVTYAMDPRVINTTQTTGYVTIQSAIDAADPYDTITVAAGTYDENITIDKTLTLEGAQAGVNARGRTGPESIIDAQLAFYGVFIIEATTTATLDGFTVRNYEECGILAGAFSPPQDDPFAVHILNNIVEAPSPVVDAHNNNIQVGDGTTGTIIGNEVSGALLVDPDWSGSGILVAGSNNVLIAYNYVHDCEGGIQIAGYGNPGRPSACGNVIENNLVEDCTVGISVQGKSISTIIEYNDVLNNVDGIESMAYDLDWPELSTPSGTQVHFNSIVGSTNFGMQSIVAGSFTGAGVPEIINAENNYWGHSSGPSHSPGFGDPVGENVNYEPWLLTEGGDPYAKTLALNPGWSIVSPDAELAGYTIVDSTLVYAYNSGWTEIFVLDAITPVFIKTDASGGIGFNYEADSMGIFTTNLEAGWNLISIPQTFATTGAILSPLRFGEGNEIALATLANQSNFNTSNVPSFYRAMLSIADWTGLPPLSAFDGYWAYMNVDKEFGVVVVTNGG